MVPEACCSTTQQVLDLLKDRDIVFQVAVRKILSEWVLVTASPLQVFSAQNVA